VIIEYIRYTIPDDRAEAFEAAYASAAEHLAAAPQCHEFDLTRGVEDPRSYVLRISWTSVEDHFGGFRRGEHFPPFLAAIRPYVDLIEEMRHYRTTSVAGRGSAVPTLYDWAGGTEAFRRLTEAFYARVPDDEILGPVFAGMPADHHRHVADWLGEVFGGPGRYSAERGGHGAMVARHLGRGLTERQRHRWVALLLETADEVGLPDDPEFRASFVGYLEWGSRMAVALSAPGVEGVADEPMPAWRWALPPWQAPQD
jgi:truncated hemoglobin YjbI/quinol monooxygenase YgiN